MRPSFSFKQDIEMEVENKKVIIKDKEYVFRPNFRAFVEYEKMSKKSINQIENLNDAAMFVYCGIKSGMKFEKKEFNIEFEDFIDMLDDLDILEVMEQEGNPTRNEKKNKKKK